MIISRLELKAKDVELRLVEVGDAAFILSLRTDPGLNKYLSSVSNELIQQEQWLQEYKQREALEQEYYFIVQTLKDSSPVGALRVYDLRADSFCWGSWIMKPGVSPYFAIQSALLVYEFGFGILKFPQAHFEVQLQNQRVVAFHQRMGAEIIKSDSDNHYFNYAASRYELCRAKYTSFLRQD